jgi:hypothetical protein
MTLKEKKIKDTCKELFDEIIRKIEKIKRFEDKLLDGTFECLNSIKNSAGGMLAEARILESEIDKQDNLMQEILEGLIDAQAELERYQHVNKLENGILSKETGIVLYFNKQLIQKVKEVLE